MGDKIYFLALKKPKNVCPKKGEKGWAGGGRLAWKNARAECIGVDPKVHQVRKL